ncbi:hypothetical protein H9L25_05835 [Terrisporobacter mayombei]|nr:hypothetical protein [Terrisporobacter mayombei]
MYIVFGVSGIVVSGSSALAFLILKILFSIVGITGGYIIFGVLLVKDLSKMIDLGMFLEGHIDEEKIYFMLSDKVYGDYLK